MQHISKELIVENPMPKPKLAIDFDGTLAQYEKGSFKESETGEPFVGAIEFLKALSTKYELYIFSARASTFRGKTAILEWIKKNNLRGIIQDVTNEKKYSFMAFIDDRAITFNDPSDYPNIARALGCNMEGSIEHVERRSGVGL